MLETMVQMLPFNKSERGSNAGCFRSQVSVRGAATSLNEDVEMLDLRQLAVALIALDHVYSKRVDGYSQHKKTSKE